MVTVLRAAGVVLAVIVAVFSAALGSLYWASGRQFASQQRRLRTLAPSQ